MSITCPKSASYRNTSLPGFTSLGKRTRKGSAAIFHMLAEFIIEVSRMQL
jgi:hypothetical protein